MQEEITQEAPEFELASRWSRLGAVLIDAVIGIIVGLPLMLYFDTYELAKAGIQPPLTTILIMFVWGVGIFIAINYKLLNTKGQTVGKYCLDISIIGIDGSNKTAVHLLTYRYLPIWVISQIPLINSLLVTADSLFIFREDKRCIHDLIAGTQVVKVNANKRLQGTK